MKEATLGVLVDISLICFIALALAMVTFTLIRRSNPLMRWGSHGNVWTGPFNTIDVFAAIALLLFYLANVLWPLVREGSGAAAKTANNTSGAPLWSLLVVGILFSLCMWGGVLAYLGNLHRINLAELFGLRRLRFSAVVGWGLVWFVAAFLVAFLIDLGYRSMLIDGIWPKDDTQSAVREFQSASGVGENVLMVFAIIVVAPITEETIYRGFIYPVIKKYSDRFFAVLFTSLLFAVMHGNVPIIAGLTALAVMLTIAYEITGCLWVPIFMHAMFNSVQLLQISHGQAG